MVLHDFDNSTGKITRSRLVNDVTAYGYTYLNLMQVYTKVIEFSPSENFIYYKSLDQIVQIDISNWEDIDAIYNSAIKSIDIKPYANGLYSPLRLGPNGKLYYCLSGILYEFSADFDKKIDESNSVTVKEIKFTNHQGVGIGLPQYFAPKKKITTNDVLQDGSQKVVVLCTNDVVKVQGQVNRMTIFDITGRTLIQKRNENRVEVRGLNQGVYCYVVELENGEVLTGKFYKE